ncbi:hypothetical protein KKF84_12895 [Myxococcota bacterium]|nr:hypothetical protein [Myxococcota bacterium]
MSVRERTLILLAQKGASSLASRLAPPGPEAPCVESLPHERIHPRWFRYWLSDSPGAISLVPAAISVSDELPTPLGKAFTTAILRLAAHELSPWREPLEKAQLDAKNLQSELNAPATTPSPSLHRKALSFMAHFPSRDPATFLPLLFLPGLPEDLRPLTVHLLFDPVTVYALPILHDETW